MHKLRVFDHTITLIKQQQQPATIASFCGNIVEWRSIFGLEGVFLRYAINLGGLWERLNRFKPHLVVNSLRKNDHAFF